MDSPQKKHARRNGTDGRAAGQCCLGLGVDKQQIHLRLPFARAATLTEYRRPRAGPRLGTPKGYCQDCAIGAKFRLSLFVGGEFSETGMTRSDWLFAVVMSGLASLVAGVMLFLFEFL